MQDPATNIKILNAFETTDRTRVKRLPQLAEYDKATAYRILDEAFLCHIGFLFQQSPVVIPTAYGRVDDCLYIHGAPASRMLKELQSGIDACVTVTLVDGLVLARSAFHHTFNYRSLVIFGKAQPVLDPQEKLLALYALSQHIVQGRWSDVRQPNEKELESTLVLTLPLKEVSAKIRTGPPTDDPQDMNLPVWSGEIPLTVVAGKPIGDPTLSFDIATPRYASAYRRTPQ